MDIEYLAGMELIDYYTEVVENSEQTELMDQDLIEIFKGAFE